MVWHCAKLQDGSLTCGWYGPWEPTGITNIIYASVLNGSSTSCYLSSAGVLKCLGGWDSFAPTLHNRSNVYELIVRSRNNDMWCVINTDRTLNCDTSTEGTMTIPNRTNVEKFAFLDGGLSSNWCLIHTDKTVECSWSLSWSAGVAALSGVESIVDISNGVCALKSDASVVCAGNNDSWFIDTFNTHFAEQGTFTKLVSYKWILCGIKSDKTVACFRSFGGSSYGQGGSTAATAINSLTNVDVLYVGNDAMCGTQENGVIKCWSSSSEYSNTIFDSYYLLNVGEPIKKLVLSWNQFGCHLTVSGNVWCWWYTNNGSENGSYEDTVYNIPPDMQSGVDDIFANSPSPSTDTATNMCIIKSGRVGCWGNYRPLGY